MEQKYGMLLNQNIKLHRQYFLEMVKLIGIQVIYRAPRHGKTWTTYGEIDSNYEPPIVIGCVFESHPDQKTMKKMGWVHELSEGTAIISVPYDTPNLQVGALFVIPSGIDSAEGRLFRVVEMSNTMVYPASMTCVLVPEYENVFDKSLYDHESNSFNLLNEEGDGNLFRNGNGL